MGCAHKGSKGRIASQLIGVIAVLIIACGDVINPPHKNFVSAVLVEKIVAPVVRHHV
jgi:hypothetical protein